jgi:hypothetical protein
MRSQIVTTSKRQKRRKRKRKGRKGNELVLKNDLREKYSDD